LATWVEVPLATAPRNATVDTGETALNYADRHWVGSPTDVDKPNEYYEGRVEIPLLMERNIPIVPEESRRVRRQFGSIRISNYDGALDSFLRSYAIDGRQIRVLFGPYGGAYSDFLLIADVLGEAWETTSDHVTVAIRDQSFSLDQPIQTNLYAGTGGAEGNAEIEGKPRPLLYGKCLNVTPIMVDPTCLIYQAHDGPIHAVDAVYDQGAELTFNADYADFTALEAASIPAGNFATAKAEGYIRLSSSPAGLITSDVRGDTNPDYTDTLDVIALRLLIERAGIPSRFIRSDTWAGVAAIAGEMGVYISPAQPFTTEIVMDELVTAVGGWWGTARDGRIRAGRLSEPEDRTASRYFDQFDIMALEQETSLIPRWRQRVGYQRNWTVQRGEDLAGIVTDERRQFLTEAFRVISTSDFSIKVRHQEASDPAPLISLYDNETDAQRLADYLHDLYGVDRRVFRMTVKRLGYLLDLNSFVHVTWPRYGLDNGKKLAVVGIREDADRDETVLRLWG
jgi:hypothetical protein